MKGLVLEGGGAKGAFHCGAVKALYDYGYKFNGVAGTSIGAINGAMIVQDSGYETMYNVWNHITVNEISNFDNNQFEKLFKKEYSRETIKYWSKQLLDTIKNVGIPADKILNFLKTVIDEDKIRKSEMDYAIVTYCLSDFMPLELFKEDIPMGELHNFIFASAYYPAFKLQKTNGKFYIDGGIYNNLPLNVLSKKREYSEIFAIRTMSKMPYKNITSENTKINYICPSEDLGNTLTLYNKSILNNIKLGYYDALRFIKGYSGNKYYINGNANFYNKIFKMLSDTELEIVSNIYKLPQKNFFECFKNKIIKSNKWNLLNHNDFTLWFLETFAKFYGIEKFNVYTPKEFLKLILYKTQNINYQSTLHLTKKNSDFHKDLNLLKILIPKINEVLNG